MKLCLKSHRLTKSPVPGTENFSLCCFRGVQDTPKTVCVIAISLGCFQNLKIRPISENAEDFMYKA